METSKMLKTFIKHLLIPYAIILGINIILFIYNLLFNDKNIYILLIANSVFSFLLGYILYGSYGRSFALIQNNKKSFVISSIIFICLNSVLLTSVFCLIAFISLKATISLFVILVLFSLFIGSSYFGCLYGLLIKNKKVVRLFFMISVIGICLIFMNSLLAEIMNLLDFILNTSVQSSNFIKYLMLIVLPSFIFGTTCNILYLKLNIAKVYSHE